MNKKVFILLPLLLFLVAISLVILFFYKKTTSFNDHLQEASVEFKSNVPGYNLGFGNKEIIRDLLIESNYSYLEVLLTSNKVSLFNVTLEGKSFGGYDKSEDTQAKTAIINIYLSSEIIVDNTKTDRMASFLFLHALMDRINSPPNESESYDTKILKLLDEIENDGKNYPIAVKKK